MITSECAPSAEPDHFELVPKTPHSARKRTPAKPLLYADEPAVLPASPTPGGDGALPTICPMTTVTQTAASDFNISDIPQQQHLTDSPKERKPTVFERLFRIKGDPTAAPKRVKPVPRPSAALPPARSKKPLTVPEEFHFRTDQRIAMKRHDEDVKEPTAKKTNTASKSQTTKTPKQARTLTVPVGPVFASDKRAAMRKQ